MTALNLYSEALFKDAKQHWSKRMTIEPDLIERLEKATGPDRELDCLIACEIDLDAEAGGANARKSLEIWGLEQFAKNADSGANVWSTHLPHYTALINAALTLFPVLIAVDIQTGTQRGKTPSWEWPVITIHSNLTGAKIWKGQARTLPIALCIAALRARAAADQPQPQGGQQ